MPSGFQRYFHKILSLLLPVTIVFYAVSCATIESPTGGPKDTTPPRMISSQPVNLSTNFSGNRLILNFNEFVELKTPEKFLLISPPMAEMPDMKIKGRSVVIKLEDSLRSNTTYNFYLGDAIVDISENNPIPNFNFAFSTGPDIDSLSLSGNVTDAFTRMPVKGALVMLYSDFSDSLPMKQIPMYVSRSAENGDFRFNSLAAGKYRAVALVDGNSDYMYNLPTEIIGFSSDSIEPYYSAAVVIDTLVVAQPAISDHIPVSINIFPEPDSTQRILKSVIAARNKLSVAFRYPLTKPSFRALNVPDSLPWAVLEWNRSNDTLNAWLLNKPDTLQLEFSEKEKIFDTIGISTTMKVTGKSKNPEAAMRLKYSTNLSTRLLEYNTPLLITFSNPVQDYDLSLLQLKKLTSTDTTIVTPVARFTDSIHRHLLVQYNWNADDEYDLYIPEGSFTGIYRDSCDSTHVVFQMKSVEEYGRFAISINRADQSYPVIIQLLSEKGAVVDQRIVTSAKRVDFGLLPPAKYGLKAIMDRNSNNRWDTGVLLHKIQPETVLIHPLVFEVRTNWELEETWDL